MALYLGKIYEERDWMEKEEGKKKCRDQRAVMLNGLVVSTFHTFRVPLAEPMPSLQETLYHNHTA
jgi:hypothetical protein